MADNKYLQTSPETELFFKNNASEGSKGTQSVPFGQYINPIQNIDLIKDLPKNTLSTSQNISALRNSLADDKGFLGQLPAILNQAVVGEIIGGSIEGIGSIISGNLFKRYLNSKDAFEESFIEELGSDITEWTKEKTPIYLTDVAKGDMSLSKLTDPTFWANLTPSVASALSILIPAKGASMIASSLTKLGRTVKAEANLGKYARLAESGMTNAEKLSFIDRGARIAGKTQPMNWVNNILVPAYFSRLMDSSREATNSYTNIYNEYKDLVGENKAKKIASDAAYKGYMYSQANIIFDIAEWTVLGKVFGKFTGENKTLIDDILNENKLLRSYKGLKPDINTSKVASKTKSFFAGLGTNSLMEGLDEMTMDFFINEGRRNSLINNKLQEKDSTSFLERAWNHVSNPNNYESFIGGALGGGLFFAGANIASTINSKRNKDVIENEKLKLNNIVDKWVDTLESKNTILKEINKAKANNNLYKSYSLEKQLISSILKENMMNNTLDLTLKYFKSMSNINSKNIENVDFLNELSDNEKETILGEYKNVYNQLKSANSLYKKELSTIRKGKDSDFIINLQIADFKFRKKLNDNFISKLESQNIDFNKTEIEANLNNELLDIHPLAVSYFEKRNKIKELENIENFVEKNKEIEESQFKEHTLQLKAELSKLKEQLTTEKDFEKIKDLNLKIISKESQIKLNENYLLDNSYLDKIKQTKSELESDLNNFLELDLNVNNKESILKRIDTLIDQYETINEQFIDEKGLIESLKSENLRYDKSIENYNSEKTQSIIDEQLEKEKEYNSTIEEEKYNNEINDLKTINDLEEYKLKFEENKDLLSKENYLKVLNKINSKIKTLEKEEKDKENINNRKDNVENKIVKEDEITSRTSTQQPLYQQKKTNNNKESFNENDLVYIFEGDSVLYNIPLEIIKIENDKITVSLERIGKQGTLTRTSKKFSKYYKGQNIKNKIILQKEVIEKIENYSKQISKKSVSGKHVYSKNDKSSEYSVTEIIKKDFDGNVKNSNSTQFGNKIDELVRDFFNNGLKSKENYSIKNKQDFDKITNRLSEIKRYFDINNIQIITSIQYDNEVGGVRVLSSNNKIGGELDIVGVKPDGSLIIIDTKSRRFKNNKHDLGNYQFKYWSSQTNIYAKILSEELNLPISTIGILPVGIVYSIDSIENIEDINLTNEELDIFSLNASSKVIMDNNLILFSPNLNVLFNESSIPNKKLYNLLEYEEEIQNEIISTENSIEKNEEIAVSELINQYSEIILYLKNKSNSIKEGEGLLELNELLSISSLLNIDVKNNILSFDENTIDMLPYIFGNAKTFTELLDNIFNNNNNKSILFDLFSKDIINNDTVENSLYSLFGRLDIYLGTEMLLNKNSLNSNVESLFDNNNSIIELSKNIVNSLNKILSLNLNNIDDVFLLQHYKINLITNSLYFKKYENLENNPTLSVEDIIKIVALSLNNLDIDINSDILNILEQIPTILNSIKSSLFNNMTKLLDIEKSNVKEELESGVLFYDSKDKVFYTTSNNNINGERILKGWSNINSQNKFNKLKEFDNLLKTQNKKYTSEYIRSIIENLNKENTFNSNNYYVELNPELNNLEIDNKTITNRSIYNIISELKENTELTLKKNSEGIINLIYSKNNIEINIGTLNNISKYNSIFKLYDNNNYLGLSELLKDKSLLDDIFDNNISKLKSLYEYKLLSESNNRKNDIIIKYKLEYEKLLNSILNYDNSLNKNIYELIDKFSIINKTSLEKEKYLELDNSVKYNKESINALIDILFFGTYSNFIENYNPTKEDILKKINYFDLVNRNNSEKFNILNSTLDDNGEGKAILKDITMPSILSVKSLNERNDLKKSVKKIDNKIQIINKRGGWVDARTGNLPVRFVSNMETKADDFYVMVESVNDKYSAYPLRANTLKNSHTNINGKNYNKQLINYVKDSILNIIFSNTIEDNISNDINLLVKTKLNEIRKVDLNNVKNISKEINQKIQELTKSNLSNIIITDNTRSDEYSYPYFTAYNNLSNNSAFPETILLFKSFNNINNTTVENYHKIVLSYTYENGNYIPILKYYVLNKKENDNFLEKLKYLKTGFSSDEGIINPEIFILENKNSISKIESILENIIPNLLRQTSFNKTNKKINFSNNEDSYTDPVTKITYNSENSVDYYLDTSSLTSDIDYLDEIDENGNKNILSNVNLFGTAKVKFIIDLPGTTSFNIGKISDPLKLIERNAELNNNPYKEVISTINLINEQIKNDFKDSIKSEHYVVEKEGNIIASITPEYLNSGIIFRHDYTKKFEELLNEKGIDNPIVTILHEHIHKTIKSYFTFYGINNDSELIKKEKIKLIQYYNNNVESFILNFEKDFNNFIYLDKDSKTFNEKNIKTLIEGLNQEDSKKIVTFVENFISLIKQDLYGKYNLDGTLDKNGKLELMKSLNENSEIDVSLLSEELFAYYTNPYIMHILSKIPSSEYKYNNKKENEGTFINKLIDLLVDIYNRITNILFKNSTFKIENKNYFIDVKNMLSDLFYDLNKSFENISDNEKIDIDSSKLDNSEIIKEENKIDINSIETSSKSIENIKKLMKKRKSNAQNLDNQNKYSIFKNQNLNDLNITIKDDSNYTIC